MRKGFYIVVIAAVAVMATSCTMTFPLYYWGGGSESVSRYEELAYKSYDKQTPESMCALLCVYEDMISSPVGTRQVPPPGICAEYGFLLLQPQTAEIFTKNATKRQMSIIRKGMDGELGAMFRKRGEEMLALEILHYPESETFILPLLKKMVK